MSHFHKSLAVLLLSTQVASARDPVQVPVNPLICSFHTVKSVMKGERQAEGSSDACGACASGMRFTDGGGSQTPYQVSELLERSRPGDQIRTCIVSKYIHCPKGDEDRGTISVDTNMRTGDSWLSSSSHICGGA
jgi:hypothetical protein